MKSFVKHIIHSAIQSLRITMKKSILDTITIAWYPALVAVIVYFVYFVYIG